MCDEYAIAMLTLRMQGIGALVFCLSLFGCGTEAVVTEEASEALEALRARPGASQFDSHDHERDRPRHGEGRHHGAEGSFTRSFREEPTVLSEPFLQLPTEHSVRVVWFTEFQGSDHYVRFGERLRERTRAVTTRLSRMHEDLPSRQNGVAVVERPVWRHEAHVRGLDHGRRVPYYASSSNGPDVFRSDTYSLSPLPPRGKPLKILLTSDLQLKPMAPANYAKVVETAGEVDAVFFAGDLINVPNRASEWFDNGTVGAPPFFASLQGTVKKFQPESPYAGGAIIQHAPLFAAIGNHEVMGRWNPANNLGTMFNDPQPRWYAELRYERDAATINPTRNPKVREAWIRDNSFELDSYLEIFTHPDDSPGGEAYYAIRIGDTALISMNVSRIWRGWNLGSKSKLSEAQLADPTQWGFGEFLFERFDEGSVQLKWLERVLRRPDIASAPYKVVMAHQTMFGLGDNAIPVLTDPLMTAVYQDGTGTHEVTLPVSDKKGFERKVEPHIGELTEVRYTYPRSKDHWRNDVEPLLLRHGVHLVHTGHSHLWNRSKVGKLNYIETSNVGNSYGAYWPDYKDRQPSAAFRNFPELWDPADYAITGDPHGRPSLGPNLANPMELFHGLAGDLPFVDSNQVTVFSILDTGTGRVDSYAFNTADPSSHVVKFDSFRLR